MTVSEKPWFSKEVSVQWVVGLVIAFAAWAYSEKGREATELAQMKAAIGYLERQSDMMVRHCK